MIKELLIKIAEQEKELASIREDLESLNGGDENGMEKCQRCGQKERDRRTLYMACFYQMGELRVPFKSIDRDGTNFYTLRVCKACRSEWMGAIESWFIDCEGMNES